MSAFGRYELRRLIGSGGMGEVYEAFDTELRRIVALKVLPASLASDQGFAERFRRESYVTSQLTDPHVIPIHRYGEIDGRLYLDMRMVHGSDLGELLHRSGPLPSPRAVFLLSQAAEALDAAHANNLIHRDVKPSNLLVTAQDFVYLVDFGIARSYGPDTDPQALTATGATIGTLAYMAPERFADPGSIDARTDVYSLACVLFECLTGRRPYPVDGLPALMHAHLALPPPRVTDVNPTLPRALDAVIARGMAKDPAQRYRSPGELARDAARAVRADSPPAPAPPTVLERSAAPVTVVGGAATAALPQAPGIPLGPTAGRARSGRGAWLAIAAGLVVIAVAAAAIAIIRANGAGSSAGTGTAVSSAATGASSAVSSSSPGGSASEGASSSPTGSASSGAGPASTPAPGPLPSASGTFGEKPTLTFPATGPVDTVQREILVEGTGPVTAPGDFLAVDYLGQVWDGDIFDNSYDRGTPFDFQLGVGAVLAAWDTALVGVPVGSRVLFSVPPADGYGAAGSPAAGISGTDTVVFVVDILSAAG